MIGYIYKITAPNGKSYIGQHNTKAKVCLKSKKNGMVKLELSVYGLKDRLKDHRKKSSNCILIKRSIAKYGWDNMKVEILLKCAQEHLDFYEKQMIHAWDTLAPNGLNCTSGGEAGKSLSEKTRKNIAAGLKAYYKEHDNHMKGKVGHKLTEETKEKIKNSLKGKNHNNISEEQKEKMRQEATGCVTWSKASQKYQVILPGSWTDNGKRKGFGLYASEEEAWATLAEYKEVHIRSQIGQTEESKEKIRNTLQGRKRDLANGSVSWHKGTQKYEARIPGLWTQTGKRKFVGRYESEEEAWAAIAEYKAIHVTSQ